MVNNLSILTFSYVKNYNLMLFRYMIRTTVHTHPWEDINSHLLRSFKQRYIYECIVMYNDINFFKIKNSI